MTTRQHELTPEVLAFCEREGITQHLHHALDLIRVHFSDAREVRADLVYDPETCEESVGLTVTVPRASDLRARDHQFLQAWITQVPWSVSDMIVTTLDIV